MLKFKTRKNNFCNIIQLKYKKGSKLEIFLILLVFIFNKSPFLNVRTTKRRINRSTYNINNSRDVEYNFPFIRCSLLKTEKLVVDFKH